jgi:hypothetical protein
MKKGINMNKITNALMTILIMTFLIGCDKEYEKQNKLYEQSQKNKILSIPNEFNPPSIKELKKTTKIEYI